MKKYLLIPLLAITLIAEGPPPLPQLPANQKPKKAALSSVKAAPASLTQLMIYWSPVTNIDYYEIKSTLNPAFTWTSYSKTTSTNFLYTITGVEKMRFFSVLAHTNSSIELAWDASTSVLTTGYKVQYGTFPHLYSQTNIVPNVLHSTVSGLKSGVTYYITVITVDKFALESDPANEISYTVPVTTNVVKVTPKIKIL
jgi:hypothetical protein